MNTQHNLFGTLQKFELGNGKQGSFYSLPALEKAGVGAISKLPVSIRLVLESVLRNCDGKKVSETNIRELAQLEAEGRRARRKFRSSSRASCCRISPACRCWWIWRRCVRAVAQLGKNPEDHRAARAGGFGRGPFGAGGFRRRARMRCSAIWTWNSQRNRERYQFLKWGMQAFDTFKVVPPGIGIVHQVNLEYLAKGVLHTQDGVYYPDTLVGTDSHTTMINGIGIVGWGVGGIEAEAGMLGQPVYFLTPDVVGVHLTGALREGVTATDLALTVTQMLRKAKVVGKFVEFYGPGAAALPVVDRATIANMAPEYGATMGFFPIDAECVNYLRATGRSEEHCKTLRKLLQRAGTLGHSEERRIEYSQDLELDLATVVPSVAGPKRPQDRIELPKMKQEFISAFSKPVTENGFGKTADELRQSFHVECARWAKRRRRQPGTSFARAAQAQNTNPSTRTGNGEQPSDARSGHGAAPQASAATIRHGSRVDRRHHQLHEHEQSARDARGGFAREKSRRTRADRQSAR